MRNVKLIAGDRIYRRTFKPVADLMKNFFVTEIIFLKRRQIFVGNVNKCVDGFFHAGENRLEINLVRRLVHAVKRDDMAQIRIGLDDVTGGRIGNAVMRVNHVDFELRNDFGKPAGFIEVNQRHVGIEFLADFGQVVGHLKIQNRDGKSSAAEFVG